ncbi:Predicted MutS-related protein involved in mismatch repair [Plasmopara halstedii]|uniref:Predicted MutS-related protein involved in mismatch repair n=1 Tax=Plasmopara halstedii TaxID=4781 RepID=A0A0P1B3T6_PLAHL|nr:Predicted MutS-related protein involved in mismatch repair [Plasmopara halstedii]CEG48997.1 Predicted MutS-related protein involved in mismatch repair [Plasmopara halstedii]|eukprot:XP_024585366.1 Predicted MutS-related protein involved in mismatch repair [Plasmopara halstedii]
MAWGKNRRQLSANSRSLSSAGRSIRRPPDQHLEQKYAQSINQSKVHVRVVVQLERKEDEDKSLNHYLIAFQNQFHARREIGLTNSWDICVEVLECGLNTWQNMVELQRLLLTVEKPIQLREQQLSAKTMLRRNHESNKWTLSLTFAELAEDTLWKFANSLMLRLKSCGILSKVLLPTKRLELHLLSATAENMELAMDEYQWEGKQVASQIVVQVGREETLEMQRILLPPACTASQTKLQNPDVVAVVDGVLSSENSTIRPVVVILRGIPGSGKSTLRQEFECMCHDREFNFVACSADSYFDTSRGYVFDVKKLGAAHNACKQKFRKALRENVSQNHEQPFHKHLVLVDNTNTQRWEYEEYVTFATSNGYRVEIIEITCKDILMAFRMGQRNSHGVSTDKVIGMFMRWEIDARARCYNPHFDQIELAENPLSNGEAGKVLYICLSLNDTAKQKLLKRVRLAHAHICADHVTLFYQPNKLYTRLVELGASFTIRGVEVVQDNNGQALRVELDEQLLLPVRNKIPHITLSLAGRTSASYSNNLLMSTSAKRMTLDPPIEMTACLAAVFYIQNEPVIVRSSPFVEEKFLRRCFDSNKSSTNQDIVPSNRFLPVFRGQFRSFITRARIAIHTGCYVFKALDFDDLIVLAQPPLSPTFDMALQEYVSEGGLNNINEFILITLAGKSVHWSISSVESLRSAVISVITRDSRSHASAIQSIPAYHDMLSALDLLDITNQENVRSTSVRGLGVLKEAWQFVYGAHSPPAIQRIDTTLVALRSSVVELLILLPDFKAMSNMEILKTKLVSVLKVCVSSICDNQFQMSRNICDVEAYSVLVSFLRAIIVNRCGDKLPSECRLSSLINLTSERLVACYLNSTEGLVEMPSANDIESGRILLTLRDMLIYMSKIDIEDWDTAFGDALLALQGYKKAQAIWKKAMRETMLCCETILSSLHCGKGNLWNTQFTPQNLFQIVVALLKTEYSISVYDSLTHRNIEVCTLSEWSHLHSLALCDALKLTASMVVSDNNDERNGNIWNLFVCTPSLVIRQVNVTTSSIDLLHNVVENFQPFKFGFEHNIEMCVGESTQGGKAQDVKE